MQCYRTVKLDQPVSKIILGCAALGEYDHGIVYKNALKAAVFQALDQGIRTFDVADCYGREFGLAEVNLSDILGEKAKELNIITKFGVRWNEAESGKRPITFKDTSPEWAAIAVENSLRRLKIECIPIYFVHWPDGKTPIEETMDVLSKFKKEGKIQHIGLSNFAPEDVERANQVSPVSFVQYGYSLIDRKIEYRILPMCNKLGIKVLCYGTLAQGFLSGKYSCRENFDKSDHRSRLPHFSGQNEKKHKRIISELNILAKKYKVKMAQIAAAWAIKNSWISGIILGAKNDLQVKENAASLEVDLKEEDYNNLNEVSR